VTPDYGVVYGISGGSLNSITHAQSSSGEMVVFCDGAQRKIRRRTMTLEAVITRMTRKMMRGNAVLVLLVKQ